MSLIRKAQEERYGKQTSKEVSYTTVPNKAVLVVGSSIKELETILEALSESDIDIYTHDDMMLAHTFPKFSKYPHLKGQFGFGFENCLLDFATFPGPIILTKNSLHNVENFYRGRLFTTDYTTTPKGIIKIENNDYTKLIKSIETSKGFKTGKQCESISIGFNFDDILQKIQEKISTTVFKRIFIIGLESFSLEQKSYFEKLIKLCPKDVLIISFSYNFERDNLIHINSCFDNYSWLRIIESISDYKIPMTVFIPKCDKNTISQIIYLSQKGRVNIYLGKCIPILLNPSIMSTLQTIYSIKIITTFKKDLEEILEDK